MSLCLRTRPCTISYIQELNPPSAANNSLPPFFLLSYHTEGNVIPSTKERKFDQFDRPPPSLPPDGSVLYVALYALSPPKRCGGVLNYRWAFLLAPNDKPETRGRQYYIREISPKVDPRDGAGGSKGLGILSLEQQRMRFDRLHPSEDKEDAQKSSAWEFEIQKCACMHPETHESGYSCYGFRTWSHLKHSSKDAFLDSDGTRGVHRNHVMWMGDVSIALVEAGDMLGEGGLNSQAIGWEKVEKTAMEFVKVQESEGRFEQKDWALRVSTWGLLERQLLVH